VPKFYVKWRMEPTLWPVTREERVKLALSMMEMVKAELKAGLAKDWGCEPSGWRGYSIWEGVSETELNTGLVKYTPYFCFEVMPVLTIDQCLQSYKKALAAGKK
jgi:hypothetical protein